MLEPGLFHHASAPMLCRNEVGVQVTTTRLSCARAWACPANCGWWCPAIGIVLSSELYASKDWHGADAWLQRSLPTVCHGHVWWPGLTSLRDQHKFKSPACCMLNKPPFNRQESPRLSLWFLLSSATVKMAKVAKSTFRAEAPRRLVVTSDRQEEASDDCRLPKLCHVATNKAKRIHPVAHVQS